MSNDYNINNPVTIASNGSSMKIPLRNALLY